MEVTSTVKESRLRAPLGFHACKIDSTGRLKLPAKYQEYLKELPDKYLFATEFREYARIFTNGSWERLVGEIEEVDVRKRFTFRAERVGGDIEVDPQGRVTLPQILRTQMKLEDQQVQLRFSNDVITIYAPEQFSRATEESEATKLSDERAVAHIGREL